MAPRVTLVGLVRVTRTVSLSSLRASLTTARAMFWLVTPGGKLNVPLASV